MNAPEAVVHSAAQNLQLISIMPSRTNPRKRFDEVALAELTESVRQHGVLQPVLVRSGSAPNDPRILWELVAGERRYRAAKSAGLEEIPAVVRSLSDIEALELQVVENLQRADLHPMEEAEGYEALRKCDPNYNADAIAVKVGKSRSYVFGRMKLTALCPKARQAFYDGKLTPSVALLIARIPVPKLQLEALDQIVGRGFDPDEQMSFRDAAALIQEEYMLRLTDAAFSIKDTTLVPQAGACGPCPKRTGNQADLFGDVKNANVCTDPQCFASKKDAHFARVRQQHEQAGRKVITGAEAKKLIPDGYSTPARGYTAVQTEVYDGKNFPKAGELAKKLEIETTLIEHPKTKELIEVVPDGALQAAMKKAGLGGDSRSSRNSHSSDGSDREKKAKAETAIRANILAAIHAAPPAYSRDDFVRIAHAFFSDIWNEYRKRVITLWGWSDDLKANPEDAIVPLIAALSNDDLVRFMLDCALVKQVYVGPYNASDCGELEAAAARRGIDVNAIRAEAKAATKAKAAKKTAKKKAAKKPKKTSAPAKAAAA